MIEDTYKQRNRCEVNINECEVKEGRICKLNIMEGNRDKKKENMNEYSEQK